MIAFIHYCLCSPFCYIFTYPLFPFFVLFFFVFYSPFSLKFVENRLFNYLFLFENILYCLLLGSQTLTSLNYFLMLFLVLFSYIIFIYFYFILLLKFLFIFYVLLVTSTVSSIEFCFVYTLSIFMAYATCLLLFIYVFLQFYIASFPSLLISLPFLSWVGSSNNCLYLIKFNFVLI